MGSAITGGNGCGARSQVRSGQLAAGEGRAVGDRRAADVAQVLRVDLDGTAVGLADPVTRGAVAADGRRERRQVTGRSLEDAVDAGGEGASVVGLGRVEER